MRRVLIPLFILLCSSAARGITLGPPSFATTLCGELKEQQHISTLLAGIRTLFDLPASSPSAGLDMLEQFARAHQEGPENLERLLAFWTDLKGRRKTLFDVVRHSLMYPKSNPSWKFALTLAPDNTIEEFRLATILSSGFGENKFKTLSPGAIEALRDLLSSKPDPAQPPPLNNPPPWEIASLPKPTTPDLYRYEPASSLEDVMGMLKTGILSRARKEGVPEVAKVEAAVASDHRLFNQLVQMQKGYVGSQIGGFPTPLIEGSTANPLVRNALRRRGFVTFRFSSVGSIRADEGREQGHFILGRVPPESISSFTYVSDDGVIHYGTRDGNGWQVQEFWDPSQVPEDYFRSARELGF